MNKLTLEKLNELDLSNECIVRENSLTFNEWNQLYKTFEAQVLENARGYDFLKKASLLLKERPINLNIKEFEEYEAKRTKLTSFIKLYLEKAEKYSKNVDKYVSHIYKLADYEEVDKENIKIYLNIHGKNTLRA